jgi:hypothetical protein
MTEAGATGTPAPQGTDTSTTFLREHAPAFAVLRDIAIGVPQFEPGEQRLCVAMADPAQRDASACAG